MKNKSNKYSSENIEILEGLEPVRKRPGMYIGGVDSKAVHHLVIEILDNSIDEVINNYASYIEVNLLNNETVQITDNGSIVDILALSSGELARVNTATLIAIRKLMSSISKSRINILFLDEVINVLDESGREKLVEVLLDEDNLNTYVVSHGWTHPLLEKIEVVKRENVSALE